MNQLSLKNIKDLVVHMSGVIIQNEVYFCELDSVAGDGDFGMSIAKGFKELNTQWETLSNECIGSFLRDSSITPGISILSLSTILFVAPILVKSRVVSAVSID